MRSVFWILGLVLLLPVFVVLALAIGIAVVALQTRPTLEGEVTVTGLGAPVTIVRDVVGVPHIFGETEADVFFALGYTHADERFFQMDLIRRYVEGRLSEILGSMTLAVDARARNRGFDQVPERHAKNLDPATRAALEAYAAGVNARLDEGGPASLEHGLLFVSPEPWAVKDTLAVVAYMADDLMKGLEGETKRRRLEGVLDPAMLDVFLPGYPADGPTTLRKGELIAPPSTPDPVEPSPGTTEEGSSEDEPTPGSNAWVVSGEQTATGAPLLANDPHLGIGIPSVWYLARLALPEGDVVGATLPGTPFVILGRNERVAWGFTNTGFDVMDHQALTPGARPTRARQETIRVRFGDDVVLEVRQTEEGPILDRRWFELTGFEGKDVVLRSTLNDPSMNVAGAAYRLMKATDWRSFVEAGRGWTVPMQNMLFASVDGDIGYTTAGLLPIRGPDGTWEGYIPYEALPRSLNPERGWIATANNRVAPDDYPYPTPGRYKLYRAVRIEEALSARAVHDFESFKALQLDVTSVLARSLIPVIASSTPRTALGRLAREKIGAWDGVLRPDRPEPLIYAAWFREVHRQLYADELGRTFARHPGPKTVFLASVLVRREAEEAERFCDDTRTEAVEGCAEVVGAALDTAMAELEAHAGPDVDAWQYGQLHRAVFRHKLFGDLPLIGKIFTVEVPVGGDYTTPSFAPLPMQGGFQLDDAASLRAIYDLSDLDRSGFMHAPGQSAHPLSPHFSDLAPRWGRGELVSISTAVAKDEPDARRLVLRPAPKTEP